MSRPSKPLRAPRFRRFMTATAGVAAIEFAYLAPLLMIMAFGTFETARAVLMHRRFQRVTAMVGYLVARETQLGTNQTEATAELNGIMRSAEHVMKPYSTGPLKVGIMSIRASAANANVTTVEWSYSYQGKAVPNCPAPKAMPAAGMLEKGNAAIMVEAQYVYTPIIANIATIVPGLQNTMTWNDTIAHAPRNNCIDYAGMNCSAGCPP